MAMHRELKVKIAGIQKIQKMTLAMQNVAASKMLAAKRRMFTSMPYTDKIREVAQHIASCCDEEVEHIYLKQHKQVKKIGYLVISTDRGMCGGLNLNLFKAVLEHMRTFGDQGIAAEWCLFGKKAELFFRTIQAEVVAHVADLGALPKVEDLVGAVKVILDRYNDEKIDALFIAHNEFVNTVVQRPVISQLLPLPKAADAKAVHGHGYIFEPPEQYYALLDQVITRYIEAQVYQALVDNFACEHVARMVAMQNATENSEQIMSELQLLYNKARQATITTEISEIVSGAEMLS